MSLEETAGQLEMNPFQRFIFLRSVPGLAEVPPEVAQVVAANTREHSFSRGALLYRQGEPANEVHYIVRGSVEIRRHGQPVRTMGPRTVVGGVASLAGDDVGYDAIALEETVTLEIVTEDSQEIFEDHFVFLRRVLAGTSREVLNARRQLGARAGFGDPQPPMTCPSRPFDLVEKMAFLRKTFSFADSQIDAIADLARDVYEVRLKRGEVLWEIGDRSPYCLMPICGKIRCEARNPDQCFVLGPSDAVGALDSVSGERRWFRAEVIEDLVAFHIEMDVLFDVLEDHFEMAMSMLRAIATGMLRLYDLKAGVTQTGAAVLAR